MALKLKIMVIETGWTKSQNGWIDRLNFFLFLSLICPFWIEIPAYLRGIETKNKQKQKQIALYNNSLTYM